MDANEDSCIYIYMCVLLRGRGNYEKEEEEENKRGEGIDIDRRTSFIRVSFCIILPSAERPKKVLSSGKRRNQQPLVNGSIFTCDFYTKDTKIER